MMPLEERDQFAVEIFMPNGTTVQRTAEVTDSLEHILKRDKRVTAVTSFIGQGFATLQRGICTADRRH